MDTIYIVLIENKIASVYKRKTDAEKYAEQWRELDNKYSVEVQSWTVRNQTNELIELKGAIKNA